MTPHENPLPTLGGVITEAGVASAPLASALQRKFEMLAEDAEAIALVVLEQFGRDDEVNDESLASDVRSIFYTLEAKKLLTFRREEYTSDSGERRRAYFWRIRDEEILAVRDLATDEARESIYDDLPADAWSRHAA